MKKIPLALQLYSVRGDTAADFAGTVAAVAHMGYTGVELAGYGNLDAKGAKAALAVAGLKVSGLHAGITALRSDFDTVVNDALLFGTREVICPWWHPGQYLSAASCQRIGEELGGIGAALRAFGLRLSFHNHAGELAVIEGRTVFDWMLSAAAPRDLSAELDVYWAQVAGIPPEKFLRDHGARVCLLHLKDAKEIGTGPVDFPKVFAAAESIGAVEWYVVEQEWYNHAPMESVRLCYEQLKAWGKA
ncbi:MAG: sugar phosphate isomerase/epimerase [Opitutaceae bacterium]